MKITDNARETKFTSDWNLFVREAGAENFRGIRSLYMRSLSREAGSKQCRQEYVVAFARRVHSPNGIWIGFAVFTGLTVATIDIE